MIQPPFETSQSVPSTSGATGANERTLAKKRVVVVDDSATMRALLRHIISSDPRLEVVAEAANANEARSAIKATNPDVITLDIEMPGMSGLEFLGRLMRLRPMPVVMVSSLTDRGSDAAIRALSLGAVDCLVKPAGGMDKSTERALTRRVFSAACSKVIAKDRSGVTRKIKSAKTREFEGQIVLLGASTGGVAALETVLRGLDPAGPPVVIVQHMPGPYLASFCNMLNTQLPQDVALLQRGAPLQCGQVRLAPVLGAHSVVRRTDDQWRGGTGADGIGDLHCPSVDALFHSAVPQARYATAAILTGLGKDGAEGLKCLRDAGAQTIGQDRASSVVYGMPKAAFELGAVAQQLPLSCIADGINRATRNRSGYSKYCP